MHVGGRAGVDESVRPRSDFELLKREAELQTSPNSEAERPQEHGGDHLCAHLSVWT